VVVPFKGGRGVAGTIFDHLYRLAVENYQASLRKFLIATVVS
jgi:hypothetical protein